MICEWFRCEVEAVAKLTGYTLDGSLPLPDLGDLCAAHYAELGETLALYTKGKQARRERSSHQAMAILDPNMCRCQHPASAHMLGTLGAAPRCHSCFTERRGGSDHVFEPESAEARNPDPLI